MMREETVVESLVDLLIGRGLITVEDADQLRQDFASSATSSFSAFLHEEDLLEPDDLLAVLSELYRCPSFDVIGHFFDHNLLVKFPKGFLLRKGIIPLTVDGNMLIVIAANPKDPELLAEIGEHVSYDIRFHVGLRGDICDAVKEFYDTALTEVTEEGEPEEDEFEYETEDLDAFAHKPGGSQEED